MDAFFLIAKDIEKQINFVVESLFITRLSYEQQARNEDKFYSQRKFSPDWICTDFSDTGIKIHR